jgi:imidazolonepropionase-like amidohydrolase
MIKMLSAACLLAVAAAARAQADPPETLFRNVRVFDGMADRLSAPTSVLVRGNLIAAIGPAARGSAAATIVEGGGRTLMPGLIDAHTHLSFSSLMPEQMLAPNVTPATVQAAAAAEAERMLLRGFTTARDMGGPIFELKARIDSGAAMGPRVWPSGAVISQTAGHGDFRTPAERSRRFFGKPAQAELLDATFIADGREEVLTATRENLRRGASQIKLMAGGGVSSDYDPLDVAQYTLDELRAAVEAAEDWNSYVAVHAYTPRAVQKAIAAGVKVIEHGQLLDEATARLMAEKGIWWSLQPFIEDGTDSRFAEGTPNREKQKQMYAGTDTAFALAKKHRVKIAFGTDKLDPKSTDRQNADLVKMRRWFTPVEVLRMATSGNAGLLALSGPRAPYRGRLGVVQEGALADLLLVDGDPIANLDLMADPARNFRLIMKDGKIHKNSLQE